MQVKNHENYQNTKYIDVLYHYIWGKEKDDIIAIDYLLIKKMTEDRLTKALTLAKIKIFIKSLELC